MVFTVFRSFENIWSGFTFMLLFRCILGHSCRMCFWVSAGWPHPLHVLSWCMFLKLSFALIILVLAINICLAWFLVKLSMYSGLISSVSFCCFRYLHFDFCAPDSAIVFIMSWFTFLLTVFFLSFSFIVFRLSTDRSLVVLSVDSIHDPGASLFVMCVMHFGFLVISLMA